MNYRECRQYIKESEKYGSVLGLTGMYSLMEHLGNPQNRLHIIHVAGTNGKGSVIAYMYTILQHAGCKVGRYVSPTLFEYRERMEISGKMISEEDFAECMSQVIQATSEMQEEGLAHPTPFEMETAAAFLCFDRKQCDLAIMEVGMGGDLDATNVFASPVLSVITSISMDHMGFLGNNLYEIAARKAGIIKKNCPMISTIQKEEAEKALKERCALCTVSYKEADHTAAIPMHASIDGQSFEYQGIVYEISLLGACQIENAVLALEAVTELGRCGYHISEEDKRQGLRETVWKGRFSVVSTDPLLIVDGAHNPDAADRLMESVDQYLKGKHLYYIMGVFRDKDYPYIVQKTAPYAEQIYTIETPENIRALPAAELAEFIRTYNHHVTAVQDIETAVHTALEEAGKDPVDSAVLTFGSLSNIGEICRIAANWRKTDE